MITPQVHGTGSLNAKIALIGEAPGAEEIKKRKPFVGKSGFMLNKLLNAAGLWYDELYITNTIKRKLPKNDEKELIKFKKSGVETSPEFDEWVVLLHEELRKSKANVFVPLGNIALYALTGIENPAITKRRGSMIESTLLKGRKVIPTIHPANTFHDPINKQFIVADFKRIKKESEFPELRIPQPNLILLPTFNEAKDYLRECLNSKRVAFDIEGVESINLISFSFEKDSAISIPFFKRAENYYTPPEELELWKLIGKICEDKSITKINQNIPYDMALLLMYYGIITAPVDDTMIAMGIAYPDFKKDLATITRQFTRFSYYKDEGYDWMKHERGSFEDFSRYSAMDALVPFLSMPLLKKDLQKQDNMETYHRKIAEIPPALYMTIKGLNTDFTKLRHREKAGRRVMDRLITKFQEDYNTPTEISSDTQVSKYLYIEKGYPIQKDKGKISANEKCLIRLGTGTKTRKPVQEAWTILNFRKVSKLTTTYLAMKEYRDGRLHGSLNVGGTRSGRWSCSQFLFNYGQNLQTLPYKVKKYIHPDEGCFFVNIDLAQAENRIVAIIAPDNTMKNAFLNGEDIHSKTAALVLGIPLEEISKKEGSCSLGNGTRSQRYFGKECNHALNYGMGIKTFSERIQIPQWQAKDLKEKYLKAYPGVRTYHNWIKTKLRKDRFLENCYGRKQYFKGMLEDQYLEKAYYFIPQSTVADHLSLYGLQFIWTNNNYRDAGVEMLLQVHDSLLIQIPISMGIHRCFEILTEIKESLETPITWQGETFTIPADIAISFKSYGEMEDIKGKFTLKKLEKLWN